MKKKILSALTLSFLLVVPIATTVSANSNGGSWSNEITYNVHAGNFTWAKAGVSSTSNRKVTVSDGWDLNVHARTMSSRPSVRMSTSSGIARSNAVTVPSKNGHIAGNGNTAKTSETVRTQVRSAINQVTNNQTIRYQFSAR